MKIILPKGNGNLVEFDVICDYRNLIKFIEKLIPKIKDMEIIDALREAIEPKKSCLSLIGSDEHFIRCADLKNTKSIDQYFSKLLYEVLSFKPLYNIDDPSLISEFLKYFIFHNPKEISYESLIDFDKHYKSMRTNHITVEFYKKYSSYAKLKYIDSYKLAKYNENVFKKMVEKKK